LTFCILHFSFLLFQWLCSSELNATVIDEAIPSRLGTPYSKYNAHRRLTGRATEKAASLCRSGIGFNARMDLEELTDPIFVGSSSGGFCQLSTTIPSTIRSATCGFLWHHTVTLSRREANCGVMSLRCMPRTPACMRRSRSG